MLVKLKMQCLQFYFLFAKFSFNLLLGFCVVTIFIWCLIFCTNFLLDILIFCEALKHLFFFKTSFERAMNFINCLLIVPHLNLSNFKNLSKISFFTILQTCLRVTYIWDFERKNLQWFSTNEGRISNCKFSTKLEVKWINYQNISNEKLL